MGTKSTLREVRSETISFRLTHDEAMRLRALAEAEHRTLPGQLRYLLDEYLNGDDQSVAA